MFNILSHAPVVLVDNHVPKLYIIVARKCTNDDKEIEKKVKIDVYGDKFDNGL